MPEKYEKIGEGGYGCVIKPSLHCANRWPAKTYKNKIAKIMLTENAKNEMKEYALVSKVDPNRHYYLGKPKTCKIRKNAQTLRAIHKCEFKKQYLENMNKTSILIMENGGPNLSMLAKEIKKWDFSAKNQTIIKNILIEFARMFEGIRVFLKHDILHHDVKPQNIVYNKKTGRMNFIDFGLMSRHSFSIRSSQNSMNLSIDHAHWSYPLEVQFLNYNHYMYFAKKSIDGKIQYTERMVKNVSIDNNDKFTNAFYGLCSNIIDPNLKSHEKENILFQILQEYSMFLIKNILPENYNTIIKRSFDTFDTYGLGISLYKLTYSIRRFIQDDLYQQLCKFSYDLLHPNLFKRLDVNSAITKYEEILKLVKNI